MAGVPRVFISYSHDSDGHRARVLALCERLRRDGIPTDLDRYVNGTPPEGWPRWMPDRLNEADRVLFDRVQEAICSDPARRFTHKRLIEEAEPRLRELS